MQQMWSFGAVNDLHKFRGCDLRKEGDPSHTANPHLDWLGSRIIPQPRRKRPVLTVSYVRGSALGSQKRLVRGAVYGTHGHFADC